jgi:hypothetical protein
MGKGWRKKVSGVQKRGRGAEKIERRNRMREMVRDMRRRNGEG